MTQYTYDKDGNMMIGANGLPVKDERNLYELREAERHANFNKVIGTYVERGYTFIEVYGRTTTAIFYHHANNELQDDIVLVEIAMDNKGEVTDDRIRITRKNFLKIATDMQDVVSLKEFKEAE